MEILQCNVQKKRSNFVANTIVIRNYAMLKLQKSRSFSAKLHV